MRTVYMFTSGGIGGFLIGSNSPDILMAMLGGLIWGVLVSHVCLKYMNEDGSLKRNE